MDLHKGNTRSRSRNRSHLRVQYCLIHRFLLRSEFPVNRIGPGYVAAVVVKFGAGIDQQHIAILHKPVIVGVMQNTAIWSGTHNAGIAVAQGSVWTEYVFDYGLDLIFVHSGRDRFHCFDVSFRRNFHCAWKGFHLFRLLNQSHVWKDQAWIHNFGRRINSGAMLLPNDVQNSKNALVGFRIAVKREVKHRRVLQEFRQYLFQSIDCERHIGPKFFNRAFDARAKSIPNLLLFIAIADEQQIFILRIAG